MNEKTLFILPTSYCTLKCDHCAINSGPDKSNQFLDLNLLKEVLIQSKKINFGNVHISGGGEPLTIKDVYIKQLLNLISNYDYFINLTTNGFWATSEEVAYDKMKFLYENGLNQLIVSLSESHLKYIPIENIINIYKNQIKTGVKVVVYLTENNNKSVLLKSFLSVFKGKKIPPPFVNVNNYMIPLGRAYNSFDYNDFYLRDISSFDTGCQSICNNICIHPNGSVTPCAMVAVIDMKGFIFGNIYEEDFFSIYNKISNSKLCSFIREKGVVKLKYLIETKTSRKMDSNFVNMCHLCYSINYSSSPCSLI